MAEILAPAGDAAAFEAALGAGADAIYLGLQDFSARKAAANFTLENLADYTARAHVLGAKVYVALNTLVKDGELEAFFSCALRAWNAGADALILQDVFLGKLLKQAYPSMELHLSTQAGVCNVYGARLAKRCGFSRVILAREATLADIAAVAAEMEAECFVQGALCTCFSGQCYFSSVIGGNSGNRGLCKQPCRKRYSIDRSGFDSPAYRLSLSDLCMGEDALRLLGAGVYSLKIEGRMRSAAYVGAAVRYYRGILDGNADGRSLSDLRRAYNRGNYTRGYAFGQDKNLISAAVQGHMGEKVGVITGERKGSLAVRSSFRPHEGDGFKLLRDGTEAGGGVWSARQPAYEQGFTLPRSCGGRAGDEVYLTSDTQLAVRIAALRRSAPLRLSASVRVGEPVRLRVIARFGEASFASPFLVEPAKSRPFTAEELRTCFEKTDAFPFAIQWEDVEVQGEGFIVRSALNAFRRGVYEEVYRRMAGERAPLQEAPVALAGEQGGQGEPSEASVFAARTEGVAPPARPAQGCGEGRLAVIDRSFSDPCYRDVRIDFAVFQPKNAADGAEYREFLQFAQYYGWHTLLYLPAYATGEDVELSAKWLPRFGGAYGEGLYAIELCRALQKPLFAGTGMNLFNALSVQVLRGMGAAEAALSKELSAQEAARAGSGAFLLAGGSLQVMELGHCPFGRSCSGCDRRFSYTLTDEAGRKFPLLRGEASRCRFTLFNHVPLQTGYKGDRLLDCRALSTEEKAALLAGKALPAATGGAYKRGIL